MSSLDNTTLATEDETTIKSQYGVAYPNGTIVWATPLGEERHAVNYNSVRYVIVQDDNVTLRAVGSAGYPGFTVLAERFEESVRHMGGVVDEPPYVVKRTRVEVVTKAVAL